MSVDFKNTSGESQKSAEQFVSGLSVAGNVEKQIQNNIQFLYAFWETVTELKKQVAQYANKMGYGAQRYAESLRPSIERLSDKTWNQLEKNMRALLKLQLSRGENNFTSLASIDYLLTRPTPSELAESRLNSGDRQSKS